MKIVLLYLRIIESVELLHHPDADYHRGEQQFLESYKKFKPRIQHHFLVVNCGQQTNPEPWDEDVMEYAEYNGLGSDCGAYQAVGGTLDCDLVVCCNTMVRFWRRDWLYHLKRAYSKNGPGVYGFTASYQVNPHLRTACIACSPNLLREYPFVCDERVKAGGFEHGEENFSLWAQRSGAPSLLVTASGTYPLPEWRQPENGFWKGDQSDCLIFDRHTDYWNQAPAEEKLLMTQIAEGKA